MMKVVGPTVPRFCVGGIETMTCHGDGGERMSVRVAEDQRFESRSRSSGCRFAVVVA